MRLIDVENLTDGSGVFSKYIHMDFKISPYITVEDLINVLDNTPTAFDLEGVIVQLEEKANYAEQKAAEYDENGNITMMDIWDTEAKAYRNALEILKSAANATDGKNGG